MQLPVPGYKTLMSEGGFNTNPQGEGFVIGTGRSSFDLYHDRLRQWLHGASGVSYTA